LQGMRLSRSFALQGMRLSRSFALQGMRLSASFALQSEIRMRSWRAKLLLSRFPIPARVDWAVAFPGSGALSNVLPLSIVPMAACLARISAWRGGRVRAVALWWRNQGRTP
ncbi:MAG: hypothetical protein JXR77_18695, partial [Lentisphaeria bacterium]|nr:hypothetical protein [Lentisphaeria bacterium]